ncbi:hypothetical protein F183_A03880 [Bryobacterales bacterium F-183]|nr:hypothetical protein F183_A03880 [Bryobacterales bacterium F-183]
MLFATLASAVVLVAQQQSGAGTEDTWWKVANLDRGTELRVYKSGSTQPLNVKMDEANAERVVVIKGKEQVAIRKEDITRLDFRPSAKQPRIKREDHMKTADPGTQVQSPGKLGSNRIPHGTTESGSTLTFGSKPDFETIYRRPIPSPGK